MQLNKRSSSLVAALGALAFAAVVSVVPPTSLETISDKIGPTPLIAATPASEPPIAVTGGQFERSYDTLPSLVSAATTIVTGDVERSESLVYEGVAFTISTIRVAQTLKGAPPATIRVFETGGPTPPHEARGPQVPGAVAETRDMRFEGIPTMKSGEQYLLFLTGPRSGIVASDVYLAINEVQGKFFIDLAGVIRFKGEPTRQTEPMFGVQRATNGQLASSFLAQIRTLLGN